MAQKSITASPWFQATLKCMSREMVYYLTTMRLQALIKPQLSLTHGHSREGYCHFKFKDRVTYDFMNGAGNCAAN
eukprot:1155358-Pelagomonas_calceolata.AAC.4